jgi:hypothetical protein
MTTLAQLAAAPRRATSAELRQHVGQPLVPCPACGCPMFNVTHQAALRCAACDSGRLNNHRGDHPDVRQHVALRVLCVTLPGGRIVAEECPPLRR